MKNCYSSYEPIRQAPPEMYENLAQEYRALRPEERLEKAKQLLSKLERVDLKVNASKRGSITRIADHIRYMGDRAGVLITGTDLAWLEVIHYELSPR